MYKSEQVSCVIVSCKDLYKLCSYFRPGCSAQEKYQFTCPSSGLTQRFGDHDRLPHPTDCSFFYACLSNGAPRLGIYVELTKDKMHF